MVHEMAQLVRDYHQALYRYAYRLSGTAADAEDLTQQVFLIAHQHLGEVREPERVQGWLFAILRNCFHRLRRRENLLNTVSGEFAIQEIPAESADSPIDAERLQLALRELPDEFRVVLLMFYFEERSYKEIAADLGIPLGTVMSRLSRAKAHLRERLEAREAALAVGSTSLPTA